jgi:hypothetical protein
LAPLSAQGFIFSYLDLDIDLDTPVSSPAAFIDDAETEADVGADSRSNVVLASSPLIGAGTPASGGIDAGAGGPPITIRTAANGASTATDSVNPNHGE